MSTRSLELVSEACRIASEDLTNCSVLSEDERSSAPLKIKEYVEVLVSSGEDDPEKIARSALGLVREFEQINRSMARVKSPSIAS